MVARPGYMGAVSDISLSNFNLPPHIPSWKVIHYSESDQQSFMFGVGGARVQMAQQEHFHQWNLAKKVHDKQTASYQWRSGSTRNSHFIWASVYVEYSGKGIWEAI